MDTIRTKMVALGGEALGGGVGVFQHMVQTDKLSSCNCCSSHCALFNPFKSSSSERRAEVSSDNFWCSDISWSC